MSDSAPLISIIIVTYNNLSYTKLCIQSLFQYTQHPNIELIIVDNNSIDHTQRFLNQLSHKSWTLHIILNDTNKGFAAANNQGLKKARGEYLVLLNNDTILTNHWLFQLKMLLDQNPDFGLIGPVSNRVGGRQIVPIGFFRTQNGLIKWAQKYTQNQSSSIIENHFLSFFCVMMPRSTFKKIGFLDEHFGLGMFEDDDYSLRVQKAGLKLGYTKRVFIFHFGGASFKKLKKETWYKLNSTNKTYFEQKWQVTWQPTQNWKEKLLLYWNFGKVLFFLKHKKN